MEVETFQSDDEARYQIYMQTSSMPNSCKFMSQGQHEWEGSTDTLDYAIYSMLQLAQQFTTNWESNSNHFIDLWVHDTSTGEKMATVHVAKPMNAK
jgi:hypothetical protein